MITSFIRAIPGWLNYQASRFFKSLRASTIKPPESQFIHLIDPTPVKHVLNEKSTRRSR